jgi:hypothetical protein
MPRRPRPDAELLEMGEQLARAGREGCHVLTIAARRRRPQPAIPTVESCNRAADAYDRAAPIR